MMAYSLLLVKDSYENDDSRDDLEYNSLRDFCHNNTWVMMRLLGLAVTFGFAFIGWRIHT
jgi:hypothetical protein